MMIARSQSGFSVLEVLAAMAMFAIVAAGFSAATIGTIKANTTSRAVTVASALVQDKMEQLQALDPATASADLTAGTHTDALNPLAPLGQAGGKFNRSWVVTAKTPKYGVSQVVVTVSWKNPGPRSVTGVAYICAVAQCS